MTTAQQSAALERGLGLHRNGDVAGASRVYQALLAVSPRNTDALHLLGVATGALGDLDRAIGFIRRAVELQPLFPSAWFNLGNLCHRVGRLDEAIGAFRRAHQQQPKNPDILCNLANCLVLAAKYDDAEVTARKAIVLQPRNATLHFNLGVALAKQGKLANAVETLKSATALEPSYTAAWEELGTALHTLSRHKEAVAAFEHALRLDASNAVVWCEVGDCFVALKRYSEAHVALDRALVLNPGLLPAHLNRGALLQRENRFAEALHEYELAIAIDPRCPEALSNIGTIRLAQGELERAEMSFRQVLQVAPRYKKAAWNLAIALLTRGQYVEGWRLYEHRWENEYLAKARRDFPCPLWLGQEPIEGKTILVHAEQGFGDTLQFARYIPELATRGATVHFQVQPALLALLQHLEGAASVSALGSPQPAIDFHVPLLSLPLAFGTTLESIPHPAGYLRAPADRAAHWAQVLSPVPGRKIGVTWSGNPNHDNDHNRSIPLAQFQAIFGAPGCTFVSLQKELKREDEALVPTLPHLHDFRSAIRDFADTAAIIEQLDLVIAVDTSTAHLAAALGKPTWVLLPFNADWRWLRERSDSPWYTSLRLLRQPALGNWQAVVEIAVPAMVHPQL